VNRRPYRRLGLVVIAFVSLLALIACKERQQSPAGAASGGEPARGGAAAAPAGHVEVVPAPEYGDVAPLVRDAAAGQAARHRKLLVYAGATWCEPCRRFHAAAASGELDAALPDLTLFEFDLDKDRDRLKAAGYVSSYIPLFVVPKADGSSSGRQVEGAIKGEGAVGFLVPKVQALLSESGAH